MSKACIGVLACAALLAAAIPARAQVRITGAISGTVMDASEAVVPGATVVLKDEGTGVTRETTTNESGLFEFPDLSHGSYSITVKLSGFQTAVVKKVVVESSRTTDVRVRMAVGNLEEVITVEGASPVLVTSSNDMSSTLNNKAITELPLAGRNAFTFARLVPGAVAPQGTGSTHYNGMPGGVINPTIDGINNSSNGFKSGGTSFFGTVPARLGAIEEVTVETGGLGGDSGVTGGVNLKFVTRRGTNQYRGSVFDQARNDLFNANTFSNNRAGLPKSKLRRHDFGGNFGGPLLPGTPLRDKMFIFINLEEEYIPQTATQSQTVLQTDAQQGVFRYQTAAGEQRSVNVLDIARNAGFQSSRDPVIASILAKQNDARGYGRIESTNNLRTETLLWEEPQKNIQYYPTARLDYQISNKLSWMGSWNFYRQDTTGRRKWPLPDYPPQLDTQIRAWWIASTGLNWAISSRTHNEFRYGIQHSGDTIPYREAKYYELDGIVNSKPVRLAGLPFGLTTMANDAAPITGRHYITTISDTLTMQRGNHSWSFGGNYRDTQWRDTSFDGSGTAGFLGLPRYSIGSPTGDPVQSIFSAASMPGVQNADLTNAINLYAFLTGRVSQVATGKVVDPETSKYSDTVYRENWTSAWFAGLFAQDRWRLTPDFTLNYGIRWEANQPPFNHTGVAVFPDFANLMGPSTGLFQPGKLDGQLNPVMRRGKKASTTDWNNFAPRVGFAWTPNFHDGSLMAKMFGQGHDTVFRGSWDITYYDEGTNMFASTAGNNPGQSQQLLIQPGINFTAGSLTLQSPLPAFSAFPLEYKDVWNQSDFTFGSTGISTMQGDLKTPYVQAWNIGVQRQIMKNTVIEVRYVGNRAGNIWHTYPLNEVNIFENGFLDDFKKAQSNLAISLADPAAVASFQNRGLPGQVALPIFEAAFGARGSQAALPVAQGFTNGNFVTWLQQGQAGRLAQSLATTVNNVCRMFGSTFGPCATRGYDAPGPYPINFFVPNPYALTGNLNITDDDARTKYHSLQIQGRRRLQNGLAMTVNYTLAKNWADIWADNATQSHNYRTLRNKDLDYTVAPFDVRHVLQMFGTYDLPFGKERRFAIGNRVLEAIAGGWTLGGILTAQSGTPFRLVTGGTVRATYNQFDSGVVLTGVTAQELQKAVNFSPGPGVAQYWIDPKFIGPDGRANATFLNPQTVPGQLGDYIYLRGKNTWSFDASMNKSVRLHGRSMLTLHVTAQNVLNHPVFSPGGFLSSSDITSTTFGQLTNPINNGTPRNLYMRAEIKF
jgi:carboxypeptidase family protein